MKKILYIDMDGVVADFNKAVRQIDPELDTRDGANYEARAKRVDAICEANPHIFHSLPMVDGAATAICSLWEHYEIYFLSTAMWNVPMSWTGKRVWLEATFGPLAHKRLILTHRKDLCIGDYLIDDRTRNGAGEFKGVHIHFGQQQYPDWDAVLAYLLPGNASAVANVTGGSDL